MIKQKGFSIQDLTKLIILRKLKHVEWKSYPLSKKGIFKHKKEKLPHFHVRQPQIYRFSIKPYLVGQFLTILVDVTIPPFLDNVIKYIPAGISFGFKSN